MFLAGTTVWEGLGSGALRRAVFLVLGLKVSKAQAIPNDSSLSASHMQPSELSAVPLTMALLYHSRLSVYESELQFTFLSLLSWSWCLTTAKGRKTQTSVAIALEDQTR